MRPALQNCLSRSPARPRLFEGSSHVSQNAAFSKPHPGSPKVGFPEPPEPLDIEVAPPLPVVLPAEGPADPTDNASASPPHADAHASTRVPKIVLMCCIPFRSSIRREMDLVRSA